MSRSIPHSRPTVGEQEAEAVRRVVLSGQLAQGREVAAFEEEMAARTGRRHAVALSSGTAGLQLALLALGIGAGDRVLIPSYVCTALLHAVRAAGAEPLLGDVDPHTRNLDVAALSGGGETCAAVILPHMFGLPAAVDAFLGAGIPLIEDCAMALGAAYRGQPVGSFGDLSVCSFYATKMISAGGEGGMILTDSAAWAGRARELREYDGLPATRARHNFKMTDVGAAMGRVQLGRLAAFVDRRREIAAAYRQAGRGLSVEPPPDESAHVYYRYVMRAETRAQELIEGLEAWGVSARRPVYAPLHRELGLPDTAFPNATACSEGDVSLPIYPSLPDSAVGQVTEALQEFGSQERGRRG